MSLFDSKRRVTGQSQITIARTQTRPTEYQHPPHVFPKVIMIKRQYDLAVSTPEVRGIFNIMDIDLPSGLLPDEDVEVHVSDCGWYV